MQLISISLRGLHGALSLDVNFNPDVTLLVGINGAGKTSVLNCIDILLRPNLSRLATLQYRSIELQIKLNGAFYVIRAKKDKFLAELSVSGAGKSFIPLTINLIPHLDLEDESAADVYSRLGPEPHEMPLWEFLKSLPAPIVITLDRTISAETEDEFFFESLKPRSAKSAKQRNPLNHVQEVTSNAYAAYRKIAIEADDVLKADIVISALQEPDFFSLEKPTKHLTGIEISRLEEKVISHLKKTIKRGDVEQQVRSFFSISQRIRTTGRTKDKSHFVLDFLGSRFRQIESLARAFNEFEKKNAAAFFELEHYLKTINNFFRDSKKELFFDETTGRLVFSFLEDGVKTEEKRSIKHLSSGERQVLILFTLLAFASTSSTTFIVDEPELSLHPKWQHEFMDAFLKLKPSGAQLLLATHSPEIVGRHKSSCVVLRGQNK